jgi:hypothetical protein
MVIWLGILGVKRLDIVLFLIQVVGYKSQGLIMLRVVCVTGYGG